MTLQLLLRSSIQAVHNNYFALSLPQKFEKEKLSKTLDLCLNYIQGHEL